MNTPVYTTYFCKRERENGAQVFTLNSLHTTPVLTNTATGVVCDIQTQNTLADVLDLSQRMSNPMLDLPYAVCGAAVCSAAHKSFCFMQMFQYFLRHVHDAFAVVAHEYAHTRNGHCYCNMQRLKIQNFCPLICSLIFWMDLSDCIQWVVYGILWYIM